jgi:hypothetical protein
MEEWGRFFAEGLAPSYVQPMSNKPGWAVEVIGERLDLDDLRHLLTSGFDPEAEDYSDADKTKLLLRRQAWANLTDASDVYRDAEAMISRLNGAMVLSYPDALPIRPGVVMKFDAQGLREVVASSAAGRVHFRGRAHGRAQTSGPSQESKVQRWLRDAETDEVRAELLIHLSHADNWFDLYKAMELIMRLGRSQIDFKNLPNWSVAKQTANYYRHASDPKHKIPSSPPQLGEARKLVLSVAARVL